MQLVDLPGDPVVLAEEDGVEGGEHGLLVYADIACKKKMFQSDTTLAGKKSAMPSNDLSLFSFDSAQNDVCEMALWA